MNFAEEIFLFDDERAYQYLKKLGCPAIDDRWAAAANVIFTGDRWEPTRDAGEDAMVYPVFSYNWDIVNIVAWRPRQPDKWYLRKYGEAMLGQDQFNAARCWRGSDVLKVFDNPMAWLLGGQKGCCPLTEDALLHFVDLRHDVRTPMKVDCSDAMLTRIAQARDNAYPMPKRGKT